MNDHERAKVEETKRIEEKIAELCANLDPRCAITAALMFAVNRLLELKPGASRVQAFFQIAHTAVVMGESLQALESTDAPNPAGVS